MEFKGKDMESKYEYTGLIIVVGTIFRQIAR